MWEGGRLDPPTTFVNHAAPITAVGSAYQSLRGKWSDVLGHKLVTGDQEGLVGVQWEQGGLVGVQWEQGGLVGAHE